MNSFLWRLARTAASIGLSTMAAWATGNKNLIWLAPVISAIAKALRDKFGLTLLPL